LNWNHSADSPDLDACNRISPLSSVTPTGPEREGPANQEMCQGEIITYRAFPEYFIRVISRGDPADSLVGVTHRIIT
jgi:hypothetical protein